MIEINISFQKVFPPTPRSKRGQHVSISTSTLTLVTKFNVIEKLLIVLVLSCKFEREIWLCLEMAAFCFLLICFSIFYRNYTNGRYCMVNIVNIKCGVYMSVGVQFDEK